MFMQIFATLFIGGFITLAAIGHVALFHAVFFRANQPAPQPADGKLRLVVRNTAEHEGVASEAARLLRTA